MNDPAAGILYPDVDREGPVQQRKLVEVELHPVAPGREIWTWLISGIELSQLKTTKPLLPASTSQPNATLVSGSFTWN